MGSTQQPRILEASGRPATVTVRDSHCGLLIGVASEEEIFILQVVRADSREQATDRAFLAERLACLPCGARVVGACAPSSGEAPEETANKLASEIRAGTCEGICSDTLVFVVQLESDTHAFVEEGAKCAPATLAVSRDDSAHVLFVRAAVDEAVILRANAAEPLHRIERVLKALEEPSTACQVFRTDLQTDDSARGFGVASAGVARSALVALDTKDEARSLDALFASTTRPANGKKKGKSDSTSRRGDSVRATLESPLIATFVSGYSDGAVAACIRGDDLGSSARILPVRADVVGAFPRTACAASALQELRRSVANQLRVLMQRVESASSRHAASIRFLHFCPASAALPIVFLLAPAVEDGPSEESLREERRRLHEIAGIPPTRPVFRTAAALPPLDNISSGTSCGLRAETGGQRRLRDVHASLPPSGVEGGTLHLVHGSYDYYHYLQDRIDDNGWGCAYRSMQTIVSWFRLQHYVSDPVPSHRDIQEKLVEIGDKKPSFVGSREWIGAMEISFLMDSMYDVTCKILAVNSGAELESKGRELAQHFDTQGTPVMMGGGVLAYTLLGIDFNEQTGDIRFLILDPHYTGPEDLNTIQKKGWVGWKTGDLFVKNAFYNLCMPQRPRACF